MQHLPERRLDVSYYSTLSFQRPNTRSIRVTDLERCWWVSLESMCQGRDCGFLISRLYWHTLGSLAVSLPLHACITCFWLSLSLVERHAAARPLNRPRSLARSDNLNLAHLIKLDPHTIMSPFLMQYVVEVPRITRLLKCPLLCRLAFYYLWELWLNRLFFDESSDDARRRMTPPNKARHSVIIVWFKCVWICNLSVLPALSGGVFPQFLLQ